MEQTIDYSDEAVQEDYEDTKKWLKEDYDDDEMPDIKTFKLLRQMAIELCLKYDEHPTTWDDWWNHYNNIRGIDIYDIETVYEEYFCKHRDFIDLLNIDWEFDEDMEKDMDGPELDEYRNTIVILRVMKDYYIYKGFDHSKRACN